MPKRFGLNIISSVNVFKHMKPILLFTNLLKKIYNVLAILTNGEITRRKFEQSSINCDCKWIIMDCGLMMLIYYA